MAQIVKGIKQKAKKTKQGIALTMKIKIMLILLMAAAVGSAFAVTPFMQDSVGVKDVISERGTISAAVSTIYFGNSTGHAITFWVITTWTVYQKRSF